MSILKRSAVEEVVALLLLGFSICITSTEGGIEATQHSVFNYNTPDLAVDGNAKTCAVSGWETGGWWKGDLGQAHAVAGVTIIGDLQSAYQLRVGNLSDSLGKRRGFEDNPLCQFVIDSDYMKSQTTMCRQVIVGRYITIQMVDPVATIQMKLCELNVIFA